MHRYQSTSPSTPLQIATKLTAAADGSYRLTVTHSGTFTLTAGYPTGRRYKIGAPQTVDTTAATHTLNIPLNYGYTTTVTGTVKKANNSPLVGARIAIKPESGHVTAGTRTDATENYRIIVDHDNSFFFEVRSPDGYGNGLWGYCYNKPGRKLQLHRASRMPTPYVIDLHP